MSALARIREKGFIVSLVGDRFSVAPNDKLTLEQIDFLKSHKAQILTELLREQLSIPKQPDSLKPQQRDKLLKYLAATDQEDQADVLLDECLLSPLRLQQALEVADSVLTKPLPKRDMDKLVRCGDCLYFQSFYAHGGAGGVCEAKVMPLGACHYAESWRGCDEWRAKSE